MLVFDTESDLLVTINNNRQLKRQEEEHKSRLEAETEANKKLWLLLEEIKTIKTQVHSGVDGSLFATTIEEQKKKIKELKKGNKVGTTILLNRR